MVKKGLLLLVVTLLTSCGVQWKYTTLNHVAQIQQFRTVPDFGVEIDTLTFSQLRWKLQTDFNFRYDIAQYALSQPRSFDWNNRLLGNRYNYYNPYLGYNNYWNRTEMWNDWVWGYNSWYSWRTPYRWTPWGYSRYGWNNWNNGWNSYYGWNTYYRQGWRRGNTSYVYGRRVTIPRVTTSNRTVNTKRTTNYNKQQRPSKNDKTVRIIKRRPNQTQSRSNGGRSRSRQIVPNQTIRINRSSNVQPRQVRRRPQPPVSQQPIRSQRTSRQRRSSGGGNR